MGREDSWSKLFDWLKLVEVDPWEVQAMVKDFCDENGRGYPKEEEDLFEIEHDISEESDFGDETKCYRCQQKAVLGGLCQACGAVQ